MAGVQEAERDALRRAAEAAVPVLQQLERERAELDKRITRLNAIIEAYEDLVGKRTRTSTSGVEGDTKKITRRTRRGEVAGYIDQILSLGGEFDETELRERINEKFGVDCPRGTLYSTLRRGRDAHKYEQHDKRWRMKA